MAKTHSFICSCGSRLAVGFALLSFVVPSSASEPDRAQTVQVIHDLAEARLHGSEIELQMAEQKLAGTDRLRAFGHASIQSLREAQLERDAARHWHRAAAEFAQTVKDQLPSTSESAAVLRPAPELWENQTLGQRIGIVTIADSVADHSPVTSGNTIQRQQRALDTQRRLLERRDRELQALQSDDPQIQAERHSIQQQIERLRWQSALRLNDWYLNEIASRTTGETNSQSGSLLSQAPQELLAHTIAIARQQSAVRGRIEMAEARLEWSRELVDSVKSLKDMGHASHADLNNAQLAARQSEVALAAVVRESRRSADIARRLGQHIHLGREESTEHAAFETKVRPDERFEESVDRRVRPVSSNTAQQITSESSLSSVPAGSMHSVDPKTPSSLLAAQFQQEWKQIANRVEHQIARLELSHVDWRLSILADLERSGAASPGELRFARIRRNLLAARLLDTEDDRKLIALQRRQIEFVVAYLNSHGNPQEAPRQLADLTDWRALKLLQPSPDAEQVAATPVSRTQPSSGLGFPDEPVSQSHRRVRNRDESR